MECLYWIYIGISMIASAGMYLILWSTQYVFLYPTEAGFAASLLNTASLEYFPFI